MAGLGMDLAHVNSAANDHHIRQARLRQSLLKNTPIQDYSYDQALDRLEQINGATGNGIRGYSDAEVILVDQLVEVLDKFMETAGNEQLNKINDIKILVAIIKFRPRYIPLKQRAISIIKTMGKKLNSLNQSLMLKVKSVVMSVLAATPNPLSIGRRLLKRIHRRNHTGTLNLPSQSSEGNSSKSKTVAHIPRSITHRLLQSVPTAPPSSLDVKVPLDSRPTAPPSPPNGHPVSPLGIAVPNTGVVPVAEAVGPLVSTPVQTARVATVTHHIPKKGILRRLVNRVEKSVQSVLRNMTNQIRKPRSSSNNLTG